ncbi:hypothetical protein [Streptomyces sp. NPDC006270]|uniref:hypothetical protein n=1 Tax=Streptomyces sp. NPDC006270 TaxID=3364741 RepID=UPI0036BD7C76
MSSLALLLVLVVVLVVVLLVDLAHRCPEAATRCWSASAVWPTFIVRWKPAFPSMVTVKSALEEVGLSSVMPRSVTRVV